jgi:hypothetical protein
MPRPPRSCGARRQGTLRRHNFTTVSAAAGAGESGRGLAVVGNSGTGTESNSMLAKLMMSKVVERRVLSLCRESFGSTGTGAISCGLGTTQA